MRHSLCVILILSSMPLSTRAQKIFDEQFNSLAGWKYSPTETATGSRFAISNGMLTVKGGDFRGKGGLEQLTIREDTIEGFRWYGPAIEKPLAKPLEIDSVSFQLHAYISSTENDLAECGMIEVSLLDELGVPVMSIVWVDRTVGSEKHVLARSDQYNGSLEGYTRSEQFCSTGKFRFISGLVTLQSAKGDVTLEFNRGGPLGSASLKPNARIASVRVKFSVRPGQKARQMIVDYVTIVKIDNPPRRRFGAAPRGQGRPNTPLLLQ
jgi:hypothetical protein